MADGASMVPRMLLPAGRMAELRHLQYSEDMQCWTVRCGHCREDLPCDAEFFNLDGRGPSAWCKACYAEKPRGTARKPERTP